MDLHTVIGLAGVVGYVASYALLQLGLLDGNGVRYSIANVLAAGLVLFSLTDEFNLASALIQVIWIVIGVSGLALRLTRRRSTVDITTPQAMPANSEAPTGDPAPATVFRVIPGTTDESLGLRPDSARSTGRPTLGLRADVLQAYQAASER